MTPPLDGETPKLPPETGPSADARDPLLRYQEGDVEAFAILLAEYRRPVYSYLARCGVAPADRDDVFQIVFLKIHRGVGQYRPDLPPHPWIFTIVANEVRTYQRRRRVRELLFAGSSSREPEDSAPGGERAVEARERVAWLEQEIRGLPPAQREVLVLASIQSRPLAEVAQALAIPLNTVKTHLRRARLALSAKLAQRHPLPAGEERS